MHVGYGAFFQNLSGTNTDTEVYRHGLSMVDRVELLGFESVWVPEHHFTNYVMVPDNTQFLTWVAARTTKVQLGAMISVLPWHDPVRLCEEWSLLDHFSNGRAILGLGRGLGRAEFEGFRVEMGESRQRFAEYTEAILNGLETGYIEFDGKLLHQPRAAIRPFPARSFRGRTYASAVSPESIDLMAQLGVGILIIAQKPWPTAVAELEAYRERYFEINHEPAPGPILSVFVAVHESRDRAQEMFEEHLIAYSASAVDHYQFEDAGIAEIPGYEYYAGISRNIEKHGRDAFVKFLAELQVWGTPDEVTEKLVEYQRMCKASAVIGTFSFGGMAFDDADANLDLFASKVMPQLQKLEVGQELGDGRTPTAVGSTISPNRITW
jgi:alkanesulfonate monooxygenase SsuD/methylene tetrahydromethanopterin reductase-like flavin-dependent oxidoreductase (luciferase family)